MRKEKIVELQGLRCIAIIAVFLHHIWPNFFGNGFLGVDIFFVVSGYIMAMILLSSDSLQKSFVVTTLNFYYRRIYRILPLYLFNILITLLILPVASYTVSYFYLLRQIKSALTFSTNFSMFFESQNYFNQNYFSIFKHYWSLCVEMQFYVIAPFLLYLSKRLPLYVNLFLLWPLLIGGSFSLVLYSLNFYGSQFYFTMLPARLYEFVAGFVAFHLQQAVDLYFNDEQTFLLFVKKSINSVITVNILTLLLLIITLFPIKLEDVYISIYYTLPITVILTTVLIVSIDGGGGPLKGENAQMRKYSILANKFCTFIGDASYSLYISHFIIVFIGKLIFVDDEKHRQLILIICIIVGVVVHIWIEKPIVKARMKPDAFLPWIIIAYLAIGYISSTLEYNHKVSALTKEIYHNKSLQIGNETAWREAMSDLNPENSAELGVYSWKEMCFVFDRIEWQGNGSLKVLIIGNSHALCIVSGVKLAMNGMYSKLKLFNIQGATPFEGFRSSLNLPEIRETVKEFKPDIIYLIFKYMDDFEDPPLKTSGMNDFRVQTMQEMTNFFSNNSKVLFISKMHFEVPHFSSLNFAEQMYRNGSANDYKIKQKDIEDLHSVSTNRWKQIKCKNCIFIDMLEAFCKNGWCSPLDETQKVPLIFDDNHVNLMGSHWLGFHFQKYFASMYKLLSLSSNN